MAARVSMPETAVDENDRVPFWKHYVGRSGKTFHVYPEPQTQTMEKAPHA